VVTPARRINSKEPFNEKYRSQFEEKSKLVRCVFENNEIIGETIESWTKPFAGMSAEFWLLPTNKPVMVPLYVAEQIRRCRYHILTMDNSPTDASADGTFYGKMAVKQTKNRLDCLPEKEAFFAMNY
jgi:hypothetical protein